MSAAESSAADSVPVSATPPVRPLQNPRSANTTWVNSAEPPMTRTYERPSVVFRSADSLAGSQLLIVTGAPSSPPSWMTPPIPTMETNPSAPELRWTTAARSLVIDSVAPSCTTMLSVTR